jgi:hypothetical protein
MEVKGVRPGAGELRAKRRPEADATNMGGGVGSSLRCLAGC